MNYLSCTAMYSMYMLCFPLLALPSALSGQTQRKVRGLVTNDKGEVLIGVNVRVKGTSAGSTTGKNGRLQSTVPASENTLVFSFAGYAPQEVPINNRATDGVAENVNSLPIIRYAEVLLNYAEAKAERGAFRPADGDKTIALLRQRAGITVTTMPATADPYRHDHHVKDINDPVLLEIRRERSIELALEGFRYDGLKRWHEGQLLTMPYDGMYVPALNTPMDLNEDGKMDVSFVESIPSTKVPGVYYFLVDKVQFQLSNDSSGNLQLFDNLEGKYEDYKYVYPIPYNEITLNKSLVQNPGWTN